MTGLRSMAVLPSADVARAVVFYRDRLGFTVGGLWPDDGSPDFAIVRLGDVTVGLDGHGGSNDRTGWSVYIYLDDVDAFHEALMARDVAIQRPPEDAFYGCRDMDILDPDGNLLAFGQDLEPGARGAGL
ncbi:MAG: VOC family protein [Pseudomonadota bacterium]